MAVYVDSARIPYGRMLMSHLMADTSEELVAMAETLGLDRWIQYVGTAQEHLDVSQTKRLEAINLGAQPVHPRVLVELRQRKRKEGEQHDTSAAQGT